MLIAIVAHRSSGQWDAGVTYLKFVASHGRTLEGETVPTIKFLSFDVDEIIDHIARVATAISPD